MTVNSIELALTGIGAILIAFSAYLEFTILHETSNTVPKMKIESIQFLMDVSTSLFLIGLLSLTSLILLVLGGLLPTTLTIVEIIMLLVAAIYKIVPLFKHLPNIQAKIRVKINQINKKKYW
jgi:hypothetical protein